MNVEHWILVLVSIQVVGFWLLLFWVVRLRRQVRCLHFCFIGISDWGIGKLREVLDYYNMEYGREHSPFLDTEKQWQTRIDYYVDMLRRARVRVPADNHIQYASEDLRIS
jgi:hypothetical protein